MRRSGTAVPLNKPIRFVALAWHEGWEFDHPTVVLAPLQRYSPNGHSCEVMVEDLAVAMCLDMEQGKPLVSHDEQREFARCGWSWSYLRRVARQSLAGREFPRKCYTAKEFWVVFRRVGDTIAFEFVKEPPNV
jgi:hypothetical protein